MLAGNPRYPEATWGGRMGQTSGVRASEAWLADSRGNPMTFYHGTKREFSRFSKDVEPNFDTAQQSIGFFSAHDPAYARRCAKGSDARMLAVHLAMANPKIEAPVSSGLSMIDRIELDFSIGDADAYVERLKAQGHDGVIFESVDGYTEYVVFDPDQIRIVDVMRPRPGPSKSPRDEERHPQPAM
jgi:hypothetical protein